MLVPDDLWGGDRTAVAGTAAGGPEGRAPRRREPGGSDRHSLCPEERHPVGDAPRRDGLRLRDDLLAAATRLARGGRLGPRACRVARPDAWRGRAGLVACLGGLLLRAGQKGGRGTGPSPVDRGKRGTKRHLVVEGHGTPLGLTTTPANRNDGPELEAVLDAVPPVRGRRGRPRRRPDKLHGDKGYDSRRCRGDCRRRGIVPRFARRGIERRDRLGRHRWKVERTHPWFGGFRRLVTRYERRDDIHLGLNLLAMCIITHRQWKRLC